MVEGKIANDWCEAEELEERVCVGICDVCLKAGVFGLVVVPITFSRWLGGR